jgi:L-ascorbate metabolism protein UlaG (beta-lactamase superfamily)
LLKIRWLGHSCFCFTSSNGTRIVADPYDENTGYVMPPVSADYVTVSHDHFDHATVQAVSGEPEVIKGKGEFQLADVTARGISTFHDAQGGARRGPNTVFVFDIDGIQVCHLGDLGHLLNSQQKAEIGKIDVLLVPTGGTYTIDAAGAVEVISQLNPHLVIPMHYRTESLIFPLENIEPFLVKIGGGRRVGANSIELEKEDMASLIRAVYILDYR